jgi:O-antigen/teichoic acid export membrane protein
MFSKFLLRSRSVFSQKSRIARMLAEDSKRSFWAFADQGVVSLGNFGVNIVLARHFDRSHQVGAFGAFWVLMEFMLFINGIQGALLIYPLTVQSAARDREHLSKQTSHSLLLTLLFAPLLILSLSVTALLSKNPLRVGIWAGIALILWQCQETTRRALMAHIRFRAALLGDALSYLGQVFTIAIIAWFNNLTLERTFQAMALTSGLACLLQSSQIGLRAVSIRQTIAYAKECWKLGKWIFYGNLTNFFSGAMFSWNFAFWAGLEMVGIYYALDTLLRLANPLTFAIGSLIMPNAARAYSTQGIVPAKKVGLRFTLLGGLLLGPYLALLVIWPQLPIAMLYGWDTEYMAYAPIVQICAFSVGFAYLATAAGVFLSAVDQSRQSFFGQVLFAVAYVIIVLPLTARFGIYGAVWGWLIASILRAAVYFYFLQNQSDNRAMLGR